MTIATLPPVRPATTRFRLNRAGILNIWQYDDQVFTFADGRMLLRGVNGAGKSKTLEMLLPFALDGDKAKMTASAKQHTSLLWLMTDGYDGQVRQGYVWVEFLRIDEDGREVAFTCGVGIRSNSSGNTVTSWHFATDKRMGLDFSLEDETGPLSRTALERLLGPEQVFERAPAYKEYVGRTLFGLGVDAYNEVLRLLYWLRQPQIGEDIEPARLAHQLSIGLPEVDEAAVRTAGDAFDELAAFGDQIDRRSAAVEAITALANAYATYAKTTLAERARAAIQAISQERQLRSSLKATTAEVEEADAGCRDANRRAEDAQAAHAEESAKLRSYEASPEFRSQTRLAELSENADRAADRARKTALADEKSATEATGRSASEQERRRQAQARLDSHIENLRGLDRRLRDTVPDCSLVVPAVLEGRTLGDVTQLETVNAAIKQADAQAGAAELAIRQRQAGLALVRETLDAVGSAETAQRRAEQDAEAAEANWEQSRDARVDAEKTAEAKEARLRDKLADWAADPVAPDGIHVPAEFTVGVVETLPNLAHEAAADALAVLYERKAAAKATQSAVETKIALLRQERADVAAQRDPAPPAPVLGRTNRPDGAALWQVVDFAEGLTDTERAGIEAALQASGLLDAWLRPDGRLLDADDRDLLLRPVASKGGLTAWLVPDVPADCNLSAKDVNHALASIGAGPDDSACWVNTDGTWHLGPTLGRAAKPSAQHIGAAARAAERARRLAGLDAALAEQEALLAQATSAIDAAEEALRALSTWVNAVPSGQKLLQAWRDVEARRSAEAYAEQANRRAQEAAETARKGTASARARLTRIASEQRLPEEGARLAAIEQALLSLAEDIKEARRLELLQNAFDRWAEAVSELVKAEGKAKEAALEAAAAETEAATAKAAYQALLDSVGDSVAALEQKITQARQAIDRLKNEEKEANDLASTLREQLGAARAKADGIVARLDEHLEQRKSVFQSLSATESVPGLVAAAGADADWASVLAGLVDYPSDQPVPRPVVATISALAELGDGGPEQAGKATTKLWQTFNETTSGAAADLQPTITSHAGGEAGQLLGVIGRDDAGEETITALARRSKAALDRDRDLLTEREKAQFEQHILGELGEAIRARRHEAKELVDAMNNQLNPVTTSQGIKTKLVWKLRADSPAEVRSAVSLFDQPLGALLPEERAKLRDVLHRLIEASRTEHPELSYAEHLRSALDYRTWYEFEIRYTRPERAGEWDRLHARSPLSEGERKVLCYLPLFAAAGAHFTSLAGAAPYAPRLVLLDDAFPKIDVRTHPLLFGLLVQLDLDFVVTSERLWGDHSTVPSLAIYETLRDPSQRGIAQYPYRWDGSVLRAVG